MQNGLGVRQWGVFFLRFRVFRVFRGHPPPDFVSFV
jgi:hypothetical protein